MFMTRQWENCIKIAEANFIDRSYENRYMKS